MSHLHGNRQVIYVERASNSLGTAAFVLSLVAFFSAGVLAPLSLILSLIAVQKPPKDLAVAGLVLSLVTIPVGFFVWSLVLIPMMITAGIMMTNPLALEIGDPINAKVAAQQAVKSVLKAPDTASFHNVTSGMSQDRGWIVSGEVTAKNPMGVPLRHRFEVKLRKNGSQFSVASMSIDDKELAGGSREIESASRPAAATPSRAAPTERESLAPRRVSETVSISSPVRSSVTNQKIEFEVTAQNNSHRPIGSFKAQIKYVSPRGVMAMEWVDFACAIQPGATGKARAEVTGGSALGQEYPGAQLEVTFSRIND